MKLDEAKQACFTKRRHRHHEGADNDKRRTIPDNTIEQEHGNTTSYDE